MAETTTQQQGAPSPSLMSRVREFIKEVRVESSKVSWPTRNELRDSTIVVIVSVILVSIFVGLIDRVLTLIMGLMFR